MKTLPHNFIAGSELTDLAQMVGYMNCLNDFMDYLNGSLYIYKDTLKEIIVNTAKELKELHSKNETLLLTEIDAKLNDL